MILISEEDLKKENLNNALDNLSVLSDDSLSTLIFCATTILQEREFKREKLIDSLIYTNNRDGETISPD